MSKRKPLLSDNDLGRAVGAWLALHSPPKTRGHSDGFVRYNKGTRDPDSPFSDFLAENVEWLKSRLASLNVPPELFDDVRACQDWAAYRRQAERDEVYALTTALAWVVRAQKEVDANRRDHTIWQAASEVAALRARRAHGQTVATALERQHRRKRIAEDTNAKKRIKANLPKRHDFMKPLVSSRGVAAAAKEAAKKGLAPSARAAEESWHKQFRTKEHGTAR